MTNENKPFEIAIIGGGIAGLTLAIALHHRGVPCKIYEQAPKFGEIGAGVSFSPNAVQAMKLCHHGVYEAFEKICTRNKWESKQKVWFDYLDGFGDDAHGQNGRSGHQEAAFTISNDLGQNGVHRAAFLDEMVKLVPEGIAVFGKRLRTIDGVGSGGGDGSGKLTMHFEDGSSATTDAIIGSDGIKSRVRAVLFGDDHPCVNPSYTHKYAYRGLIPMEKAIEAVGEERATNAVMYMGPGAHMLTFPVNQGKVLNVVAFKTNMEQDWPDYKRLTRPAKQTDAIRDFDGFGSNVMNLLKLTKPDLDCWAIFDLGENPVPKFNKGRVCIAGDAAHATSPHHGAGAGFCIEDAVTLASLLAHESVRSTKDIETAFEAFDTARRERGHWLVQSSRFIGDSYEWRAPGVGRDFGKIEREINERNGRIGEFDVEKGCQDAVDVMEKLQKQKSGQ